MGYKWPARSVERLPPFRRQQLQNQILIIGNSWDPITSVTNARFVAELLGDQAVLVEQLGFGHTTLAESSNCTDRILADHIMRGIVSLFLWRNFVGLLIWVGTASEGEGDEV